jgi:hypothetical protein
MGPGWGAVGYGVLAGTAATTSPMDYTVGYKENNKQRKGKSLFIIFS